MPELPEVARTAIRLNHYIEGSVLNEIKIHSGRYSRHGNPSGMDEFIKNLPAKIESVDFHGKMLIFTFIDSKNKTWWMWNTFGMTGGWKREKSKHGHVELVTSNGSYFYTDSRNFGTIKFVDDEKATQAKINSKGPNHLKDDISDELFAKRIRMAKNSNICTALMNQRFIGGIGNYIKAEILYRSRISPWRTVDSITDKEMSRLNKNTREVVRGSFANRGATIHSYSGLDWEKGEYPFFFHVYGKDICYNGYSVKREITPDKRTTHWVSEIQK